MIRVLVAAALLAFAPAALAERLFSLEAAGALMLRDDPLGSSFEAELAWGARAGFAADPLLSLPPALRLGIGLLWYGGSQTEGTRAVQVQRTLHSFALPVQLGWELPWHLGPLRFAPYAAGGPALTRRTAHFRIASPPPPGGRQVVESNSVSGFEAGGVYGLGISTSSAGEGIGFGARLEALRIHRGPNVDLALGLGLGTVF